MVDETVDILADAFCRGVTVRQAAAEAQVQVGTALKWLRQPEDAVKETVPNAIKISRRLLRRLEFC